MMDNTHPSNRLYYNMVGSFQEALEAIIDQCDFESNLTNVDLSAYKEAARKAYRIYRAKIEQAERAAFLEMSTSEDEDLRDIGKAALEGDYSELAI